MVITGPFGAGKTTFIRSVSEITMLSTESEISDGTETAGKRETTVAIDFGRITIADDLILYLFGTPGQERFDFMWEVASRGMLGYIVLLDCARPESLEEAKPILEFFGRHEHTPFLVAANKTADFEADRRRISAHLGVDVDLVIPTDALDRASVKGTLVAFLERVLTSFDSPGQPASVG